MTIELWVSKGELKQCENPGGAFDDNEMKEMFDMPDGIRIREYDVHWEANIMANILLGKLKPDNTNLFNECGQNYITALFVRYVNAVRKTIVEAQ